MFVPLRIYYDKKTGTIIQYTGNFQDNNMIQAPTIEDDFTSYKSLHERVKETVGVIELERNQYEEELYKATKVTVDVKTGQLVFDFTPIVKKEIEEKKSLEERVTLVESTINDILLGGM
ncbi:hypothetical protein [Bacillus cereus group sp. MG21]|uniref:hypothetical protein n=1 Tax=Bacillus cereus group sp. MG21 TaxID=3040251 RepID=UPI0033911477